MVGNVQAPWDVHPSPTLCGQWLKVLIAMDRRTLLGALGLALAAPLGSASAAEPPKYTRPGRVYNQNGAYELPHTDYKKYPTVMEKLKKRQNICFY